ncbi:MAG: carbohydrate kinase [Comamonadaceae bacterium PBBC1]|nr:MAG: carbohydrate kinase [Comamonadaceae bacterium PBBC1]
MTTSIFVLGEALMDCIAQPDGQLRPLMGGSPYNLARAAALRGASVTYLNPLSTDNFGQQLQTQLVADGVQLLAQASHKPTSLAVVQVKDGQPSYGFYREGIADRDYSVDSVLAQLKNTEPGILHTGSLALVPPEHEKVLAIVQKAKALGWTVSVDINLRPKLAADLNAYVAAVRSVMVHADWLKASDEDLETLGFEGVKLADSARLVAELRSSATPGALSRIALTYGGDGAYLNIDGQHHSLPVPHINLADTVGAGDTFWGNTLADWALQTNGAAQRVAATLELSMKAAAINCTRQGCHPPTWTEVQAF